jgi:hypothetical protein
MARAEAPTTRWSGLLCFELGGFVHEQPARSKEEPRQAYIGGVPTVRFHSKSSVLTRSGTVIRRIKSGKM